MTSRLGKRGPTSCRGVAFLIPSASTFSAAHCHLPPRSRRRLGIAFTWLTFLQLLAIVYMRVQGIASSASPARDRRFNCGSPDLLFDTSADAL